jgi:hypothetical protein
MRYFTIVRSREDFGPPPSALIEAVGALGAETKAIMAETGGLSAGGEGVTITVANGELTQSQGLSTAPGQTITAYAIYDADTEAEVLAAARRFMEIHHEHWPAWEGQTEIRQAVFHS